MAVKEQEYWRYEDSSKRKRRTMDRHSWPSADIKLQIDELERVAVNAI